MLRWVCAVAMLVSTSNLAAADDGDDAVADAEAAVAAGDLVKAAGVIERGLIAAPKNLKLLFLRGKVELERRRFASALAAYEAYLEARPRGANKRKAERIVENLAAVKTTFLEVTVKGGGAEVYVDDKSLGVYCVANSVCTVGMMPGRYRLLIEGRGSVPITRDVVVREGQKARVSVALEVPPTPLTIRVTPGDAAITFDGGALGSGERQVDARPGEHELIVSRAGFETVRQTIAVRQGQAASVEIALPELVRLSGLPDGATPTIALDSQPVKLQFGAIAVPSDGRSHQLVVQAPGYRDYTAAVSAGRDGEPIAIAMVRAPVTGPIDGGGGGWSTGRKTTFIALLAAGGVGVGLGALFGIQAVGKNNDADALCDDQFCTQEGLDLLGDARSRANLSNLSFGVGGLALAGALIAWLTAPSGDAAGAPPRVEASIRRDGGGQLSVRIGF